ncbi:MAG: N-acetylmuramoyl-L-alanine amidase [Crocinitomicaceae bacterium]|nr:N-acetylmuramoyl-L-alanine amidase [Crocinitomicaceae bacterium]
MKHLLLLFCCVVLTHLSSFSQYTSTFQSVYMNYPSLPKGVLEAVSWSNTHIRHISVTEKESCAGMPRALGVMGLFYDGKNYFRENGNLVASLSGMNETEQLLSPENQILAYGSAFNTIYENYLNYFNSVAKAIYFTLNALSEIPDSGNVNKYALDAQIYQVLNYMNNLEFANLYQFQKKNYDLKALFGAENLKILTAKKVVVSEEQITNELGNSYTLSALKSSEYGPAVWDPAPSCNYSSRSGTAISAITIHTIQGSYAGAISWSKNCESNVSYHYVIRSSDGQVTQMVLEANKAWHVGSENPYTIGYEHEGWIDDGSWYTQAMYQSSADLSRDVTNSGYGIPPLRTYFGVSTSGTKLLGNCTKIKGHQHYPNQTHTDPGIYWDWEKYYKLINNTPTITTITNANGNLYDTGGATGDYGNDERKLWLIQPANTSSISIHFSEFNIENNWDYLFLYDGATTDAPLIGKYTGTNSPGTITSTSGSLLIEFRSDCATTASGWAINYTSVSDVQAPPVTSIVQGNQWKTSDFMLTINDVSSQSTIEERYYLIADRANNSSTWKAQPSEGFFLDDFTTLSPSWVEQTSTFSINNGRLECLDETTSNSNIYLMLQQTASSDYLYQWTQRFNGSGANQRAGLHFMCSDPTLTNRGNSYFVYLREANDKVQIYSVTNDVFTLQTDDDFVINNAIDYHIQMTYSPTSGWIKVYINGQLASSWQDANPLQSGNSISIRTANTVVEYDNFSVLKSRSNFVQVSTGLAGLIKYESENGQPTGRVLALAKDALSWSSVDTMDVLLDKTSPVLNFINDGVAADVSQFWGDSISANWSFSDIHSDVTNYEYAVGTTPNGNDVLDWTSVGTAEFFTTNFENGIVGQMYYVSIKATNGADLVAQISSDGQKYIDDLSVDNAILETIKLYPNPFTNELHIEGIQENSTIELIDMNGKVVFKIESAKEKELLYLDRIYSGVYSLKISNQKQVTIKKVVKS